MKVTIIIEHERGSATFVQQTTEHRGRPAQTPKKAWDAAVRDGRAWMTKNVLGVDGALPGEVAR